MKSKTVTIKRNGSPVQVAAWFKTLTAEGKRMIGQNNISAPYGRHMKDALTKVEYTYKTEAQFLAECAASEAVSLPLAA